MSHYLIQKAKTKQKVNKSKKKNKHEKKRTVFQVT